jgi:hypothetical protein
MSLRILAIIAGLIQKHCFAASAPSQVDSSILLIQPLTGGSSSAMSTSGTDLPLFQYITEGLVWLHEVAIGIVILWLVFSGMQIMISGNDQGKRTEAKDHMIAAIIGLLMLFLLGFILSILNPSFFLQ